MLFLRFAGSEINYVTNNGGSRHWLCFIIWVMSINFKKLNNSSLITDITGKSTTDCTEMAIINRILQSSIQHIPIKLYLNKLHALYKTLNCSLPYL